MEIGIFSSHVTWRIRYRKVRKEAKETGKSIEEILEKKGETTNAATDGAFGDEDIESQKAPGNACERTPPGDSKEVDFR
jgi:hypothetical protein